MRTWRVGEVVKGRGGMKRGGVGGGEVTTGE